MQAIVPVYRPSLFASALALAGSAPAAAQRPARASDATSRLAFRGAWPNPFSRATLLRFWLPRSGAMSLKLFNVAGEQVAVLAEGMRPAGEQTVELGAGSLRPGLYFASLKYSGETVTRSVILVP